MEYTKNLNLFKYDVIEELHEKKKIDFNGIESVLEEHKGDK